MSIFGYLLTCYHGLYWALDTEVNIWSGQPLFPSVFHLVLFLIVFIDKIVIVNYCLSYCVFYFLSFGYFIWCSCLFYFSTCQYSDLSLFSYVIAVDAGLHATKIK